MFEFPSKIDHPSPVVKTCYSVFLAGISRTFYNWKVYDGYKLSPEINGLVQLEERNGSSLEYCLSVGLG